MKDYKGNELAVGDIVLYMNTDYKQLMEAPIIKIGEKKITLKERFRCSRVTFRYSEQVVCLSKIAPEAADGL